MATKCRPAEMSEKTVNILPPNFESFQCLLQNPAIKQYFVLAQSSKPASCWPILILPPHLPDRSPCGNSFQEVSMPVIQFLNVEIYFNFIEENKYSIQLMN